MAKLVLILAYQIGKIWEISTLLTDDSALKYSELKNGVRKVGLLDFSLFFFVAFLWHI